MEIVATEVFVKSVKKIAKRYKTFNADYQRLLHDLDLNPELGVSLGDGFYKVRMAIQSKGKGKSGGCRVITFNALEKGKCLYLIYAYDKSDVSSVDVKIMRHYAKSMGLL